MSGGGETDENERRPRPRARTEGLMVHVKTSEVESVLGGDTHSRSSFHEKFEGGKRRSVLQEFNPPARDPLPARRASLQAMVVKENWLLGLSASPVNDRSNDDQEHEREGHDSDASEEWDPNAAAAKEDPDALQPDRLTSLLKALRSCKELSPERESLLRSVVAEASGLLQGLGGEALLQAQEAASTEPGAAASPQAQEVASNEPGSPPASTQKEKKPTLQVAQTVSSLDSVSMDTTKVAPVKSEPAVLAVSSEKAATYFTKFLNGKNMDQIEDGFRSLVRCAQLQEESTSPASQDMKAFPYLGMKKLPGLSWKAKAVWELLDAQFNKPDHQAKPFQGKSLVVVGAGPVGLRLALQLRLGGASVTILEKRGEFTRINRLHLWEWVKQDLILWGAKVFTPPGGQFGSDQDFCHIRIRDLQHLLLKCCLLLGVHVELGVEFCSNAWKADKGWIAVTKPPLVEDLVSDALICCDGASSKIATSQGAKTIAGGLGKEGQSIGLVANFANGRTQKERNLRQFSWAKQFNDKLFKGLKDKVGADLQNIIYYRGDESHYMISTPSKQCLIETGCLHRADPEGALLDESNVDYAALKTFAQQVAEHFELPTTFTETQSLFIFDFSDTHRHEQALFFLEKEDGPPMLIAMAGDALLEPFWPTGLGCIRGFLSALDCVSSLGVWFTTGDREAVATRGERAYRALKSVEAQTKDMTLKPESEWRLDPATRYRVF